ncbi:TetR/AcrR family transcriptional regulator C-terminal domain-containing protein [Nonomuraea sp. NPDC050310]|uniref:TetR/AcrR family transcriptional regulator n=1 Tax=Nonomuraea sp. NPDC050310 TaxID=3154935 RepID=UPI00340518AA
MNKQFSSVWTREPRPVKPAGLSRDQIVATALDLLDAEGLDALSMRKLGARLNAGATSIYWHVANKEELLELAYDAVWGEVKLPEPEGETLPPLLAWRTVVRAFCFDLRAAIIRHPWMGALLGRLPALGPNTLGIYDRLRKSFRAAGFAGLEIDLGCATVLSYVMGQVIPQTFYFTEHGGPTESDMARMLEMAEQATRDFPDLMADLRALHTADHRGTQVLAFEWGLMCVLDGLEARLNA